METHAALIHDESILYHECLELLRHEEVGRLALIVDGQVEIFPVSYGLDGDGIVFRTDDGTKTKHILESPVAFEVDHTDPATRSGWSVIVHGTVQDITKFDNPTLADRAGRPWTGPKQRLMRITPRSVTGRIVPHTD